MAQTRWNIHSHIQNPATGQCAHRQCRHCRRRRNAYAGMFCFCLDFVLTMQRMEEQRVSQTRTRIRPGKQARPIANVHIGCIECIAHTSSPSASYHSTHIRSCIPHASYRCRVPSCAPQQSQLRHIKHMRYMRNDDWNRDARINGSNIATWCDRNVLVCCAPLHGIKSKKERIPKNLPARLSAQSGSGTVCCVCDIHGKIAVHTQTASMNLALSKYQKHIFALAQCTSASGQLHSESLPKLNEWTANHSTMPGLCYRSALFSLGFHRKRDAFPAIIIHDCEYLKYALFLFLSTTFLFVFHLFLMLFFYFFNPRYRFVVWPNVRREWIKHTVRQAIMIK